ncbi:DinB family protein [Chitinophagaceae bacterium MMS25-I14]
MLQPHTLQRLQYLIEIIPGKLLSIPEEEFAQKPVPEKWSKKEILGHLIDSAANNHQRFVRTQFEDIPAISYDQNGWNHYSYYNQMDQRQLVQFWEIYNRHLLTLASHIPAEFLERKCRTNAGEVTLQWLVEDYVVHMEHHLKQLTEY